MEIWLIYRSEDAKRNAWYINEMITEGAKAGLKIRYLTTEQMTLLLDPKPSVLIDGKAVSKPIAAIVRTMDPKLSSHLAGMGIRLFNTYEISCLCNDKANTYQEISKLSIPMVPTRISRRENVMAEVLRMNLPCVVKTVDGHGGSEVFLITNQSPVLNQMEEILKKTSSDFVVQPLVGSKHQDLRVYILGNRIITSILRTSNEGFRSNFSLGGNVSEYQLKESERKIVQKILAHYSFDLAGIDFIIDDDGTLIFNEIEDVVGARMLYQCTDYNLVREYIAHIKQCLVSAREE